VSENTKFEMVLSKAEKELEKIQERNLRDLEELF
jgi:hypothetical protein